MENKNPQLEDGYLKIANEIWEALGRYRISGEEWLVLNCIIRKTYGYNKKEDWISESQFIKYTTLHKQSIYKARKKLQDKNIIVTKKGYSNHNLYCFNKQFNSWKVVTKKGYSNQIGLHKSPKKVTGSNQKGRIQNTYTKDIYTKYNSNKLLSMFKNVNPSYERLFSNKTQRSALDRLVIKYGEDWVVSAINRLPQINAMPYAPQTTTPYELEIKLGKIKAFLEQEKNKAKKGGVLQL